MFPIRHTSQVVPVDSRDLGRTLVFPAKKSRFEKSWHEVTSQVRGDEQINRYQKVRDLDRDAIG
jgi:hypothetical protein